MAARVISLRYDGTCVSCTTKVSAKTLAWWDSSTKHVTCVECRPAHTADAPILEHAIAGTSAGTTVQPTAPRPLPPPSPIVTGTAGISAAKQYERRAAREQRTASGRSAAPSRSTSAWAKGADGEERLGRQLSDNLSDVGHVLHDRKVPKTKGNIDHLVIAPSGIWIVDAKNYTGKVERRHVGGLFTGEDRLYVNGRNQTKLVEGLDWQRDAVHTVIEPIGFGTVPIHRALCFTNSSWGMRFRAIKINGAIVTWAKDLINQIREPGQVGPELVALLTHELSSKLPAST
jgi:hypothetical protein